MDALAALLHDDATMSMPPIPLWLQGADQIVAWNLGHGKGCRGSRFVPAPAANGSPAYGQYRPSGPGGRHEAWSLHVLDIRDERIARIEVFLDVERVFPLFGLPLRLDDEG